MSLRLATPILLVALAAGPAAGLPLDPGDFASLGPLPSGSFTLDTGAGGGGVLVSQGGGAPDVAVFTYDGGALLGAGDTITVTGPNALAILFQGPATIAGTIDVSGGAGIVTAGGAGVAGGGRGGNGGPFSATTMGQGPGGGSGGASSASASGVGSGAGGGFGTAGAPGGGGSTTAPGGASYGDSLLDPLHAGSGGGGGGGQNLTNLGAGGGAGGGALELGALSVLELAGASLLADGGDGGDAGGGVVGKDGGGGSGGGLLLHAFDVVIDAGSTVRANGGFGGAGADVGGCGGAGRVAILFNPAGGAEIEGTVEARGGGSACLDDTPLVLAVEGVGEPVPEPSRTALLAVVLVAHLVRRLRLRRG